MRLDYITQELWIEAAKENLQPKYPWQEPLKVELQHFADCVTKREKPKVTGTDGIKALRIAEAALLSSVKNKAIKLE
jgi:predicted dehydrogenase